MRFLFLFPVLLLVFALPVLADGGGNRAEWGEFANLKVDKTRVDFEPYEGGQKHVQRFLWDTDDWTPQDWIKDDETPKDVIREFYSHGLIHKQFMNKRNIPVLVVGEPFNQLSGLDQRRVLKFVDYTFDITGAEEDGMFFVYYVENDKDPLGLYNRHGYQNY